MKATIYKLKKSTRGEKHPPKLEVEMETDVSAELHAEVLTTELQKRLNREAGSQRYTCAYYLHDDQADAPEASE